MLNKELNTLFKALDPLKTIPYSAAHTLLRQMRECLPSPGSFQPAFLTKEGMMNLFAKSHV